MVDGTLVCRAGRHRTLRSESEESWQALTPGPPGRSSCSGTGDRQSIEDPLPERVPLPALPGVSDFANVAFPNAFSST